MRKYDRIIIIYLLCNVIAFIVLNIVISDNKDNTKQYLVEINRVAYDIENGSNCNGYETIIGVYPCENADDFYESDNEYVIREINDKLYRIEYKDDIFTSKNDHKVTINLLMLMLFVFSFIILVYIRQNILKPFKQISNMPSELAKGNLTVPLNENKSRYFGKFTWGLDVLRSKLENNKKQIIEQAKSEKTLILSLSHDIKTPLSAIKLYSKALSKGLYEEKEKQKEVLENINQKVDEIEHYVSEIISKSNSAFSTFEVNNTEFYISEVVKRILSYYSDKLSMLSIEFDIKEYSDCLIYGDADRLEEVIQNIIENAVKYGDGHNISISFKQEDGCQLITVSNTGCSLPENELSHIFDSFWRGSNSGKKEGSGLGLYICKKLMHEMNGDIFAEIKENLMLVNIVCSKA